MATVENVKQVTTHRLSGQGGDWIRLSAYAPLYTVPVQLEYSMLVPSPRSLMVSTAGLRERAGNDHELRLHLRDSICHLPKTSGRSETPAKPRDVHRSSGHCLTGVTELEVGFQPTDTRLPLTVIDYIAKMKQPHPDNLREMELLKYEVESSRQGILMHPSAPPDCLCTVNTSSRSSLACAVSLIVGIQSARVFNLPTTRL